MDYFDFLRDYVASGKHGFGALSQGYDVYNSLYNTSHGAERYWLSKVPFLSRLRELEDAAKKAQDSFVNTGKDPAYIDRVPGTTSGIGSISTGVSRMARSLSDVYTPEVIENVQRQSNNMYW